MARISIEPVVPFGQEGMVPDFFSFDALPSPEPILVSLGQPLAWFRAPFPAKELYRRG
jgi:hypothetical protein